MSPLMSHEEAGVRDLDLTAEDVCDASCGTGCCCSSSVLVLFTHARADAPHRMQPSKDIGAND
jgi:hypothetical protein